MTEIEDAVTGHYGSAGGLFSRVLEQLEAAGVDRGSVDEEVLSGVDEFHLGGRAATLRVVGDLGLPAGARVLDIGSGIGGPARTMAAAGHRVTGVDLTPRFVEVAGQLSALVGLGDATTFLVGDAAALDIDDGSFDAATMFHVGMNLPDKVAVFAEIARVLRPGGRLGVYDLMRTGQGELTFPLPWAGDPTASHLEAPEVYVRAVDRVGLELDALESFAPLLPEFLATSSAAPPELNLSVLMGEEFPTMFANVAGAMGAGLLEPMELLATKPS